MGRRSDAAPQRSEREGRGEWEGGREGEWESGREFNRVMSEHTIFAETPPAGKTALVAIHTRL